MASVSDYLAKKLLEQVFRGTAYTFPTTLYLAACTTTPTFSDTGSTIVEPAGGSYGRLAVTCNTSNWGAASGSGAETLSNAAALTFTTATASWGTITGGAILDASTTGNMLFYFALSANKTVGSGDVYQFAIGALTAELQ